VPFPNLSRATKNANVLMEKGTDMMSGTDESIRLFTAPASGRRPESGNSKRKPEQINGDCIVPARHSYCLAEPPKSKENR